MGLRDILHLKKVAPESHVYETFEALEKLVQGAQRRRLNILGRRSARQLFAKLSEGQSPDTFSICCSDSRYTSPGVFDAKPGVLFGHENIGNQIRIGMPTDSEAKAGHKGPYYADESMLAGIEFALKNFKVRHILVLGHTGCGAMAGALDLDALPFEHVRNWLADTRELNARIDKYFPQAKDTKTRQLAASQENVLMQMERLHRFPIIKERVEKEELAVYGFVFELSDDLGVLSGWDPKRKRFVPINAKRSSLPERKSEA